MKVLYASLFGPEKGVKVWGQLSAAHVPRQVRKTDHLPHVVDRGRIVNGILRPPDHLTFIVYPGGDAVAAALTIISSRDARPMDLDPQVCSRARLARDARFDGKFFIGVLSTRIYCRPICRTRTSKEENVRYFPTAAAAAEAGFRPCLRCRPECSPGTPAWLGTSNTVSRALRLIGESGLEDGGIEGLADRLGVGSRHLRRLFIRHLGATPVSLARTRRLHFAKKLIYETSLPMNQIALASGFGSVRRFNAAISKTYHRTPTQVRRLSRHTALQPENQYLFRLPFRPPYAWNRMLAFLAPRATPGVESVELGSYRRSISLNGKSGYFEVSFDDENHSLLVRVQFGDPHSLFFIIERIRAMFDLNADWSAIASCLEADSSLNGRLQADPGLRVPGCWNGFELAIRAILGQQISVKGHLPCRPACRSFRPALLSHKYPQLSFSLPRDSGRCKPCGHWADWRARMEHLRPRACRL